MATEFQSRVPDMSQIFEERQTIAKILANQVRDNCASQNVNVPLNLCAYLVDLKLLQSSKLVSELTLEGDLANSVVEKCTQELLHENYSLKTIKVQVFWFEKYRPRDAIKKIHHKTIFKNVFPIMTEIVEGSLVKGLDKEEFCKKVVVFIIMFAGLGSPAQQGIIQETQAALYSIFKTTEVENFINLPKPAKEQQLIEFARLVTGIRLFNKDCKKGGEGIEDLPLILTQGVRVTRERLFTFKDQLDTRTRNLVGAFLQNEDAITENGTKDVIKTLLIYLRQAEYFLKELLKNLDESFSTVEGLVERLQGTLLQIHEVVRYRVAIATAQIFPLFLQLSDVWVEMQEEVDILSEINNNFVDLSVVNNYEGFCAWTLVRHEGFLIPGNISIGILNFSNRFYSFSSAEAAHEWAKNPTHYIKAALGVVRARAELIRFLNLYTDLEAELEGQSALEEGDKPERENAEVQTETHPVERYICREHTFSEWELKRRVLKLATLTRCTTKSQQTMTRSTFRADVGVQVITPKNVSTQTRRENHSARPVFSRSVFGLRSELCVTDSKVGVRDNVL